MTNDFIYKPNNEDDYENNCADFIEFCTRLPTINNHYNFEENYWSGVCNFTKFGASNQDRSPENLLHHTALPFAKSYITYKYTSKINAVVKLYAIKAISEALVKRVGFFRVEKLTLADFDEAAAIAQKNLSTGAAYQAGRGLKNFLSFLVEKKFISSMVWKSPIRKPKENEISEAGDKQRLDKMPDERALMALARIFAAKDEDLTDRDVFTTSVIAMLLSAPARGSEPMYLRKDCLYSQIMPISQALEFGLSMDDIETLRLLESQVSIYSLDRSVCNHEDHVYMVGLNWISGKEFGPGGKGLPTVMIETVLRAVKRLQKLSEGARNFAKMIEDSPNFPRHQLCPDLMEDQLLTSDEVALALGYDLRTDKSGKKKAENKSAFLKRKGLECTDFLYCLHDLNIVVRRDLPEGFPFVKFRGNEGKIQLKWSDALFAVFQNQLDSRRATIFTELAMPTINTLNEDLSPTKKKNRVTGELATGRLSIFQRWNEGGLSIRSHQLRHMLDTLAAVNGMDGDLRARWAQRSDPTHNRYYDHTTPEEYGADLLEFQEQQLALKGTQEVVKVIAQVATPRTIQELNTKASLTAHSTEFGICTHSYLSEPCTKYRDCINCNEHVCIKGDDGKCDRIRARLETERKLLLKDKVALDENVPGAARWYQRRARTVDRMEQILCMLNDDSVADGALIKLTDIGDDSLDDRTLAKESKILPPIINYTRLNAKKNELDASQQIDAFSELGIYHSIGDLDINELED